MDASSDPTLTQVLDTLRAHEAELHARGVKHAAIFGSVARGEAGPESDVDIMLDIDHGVVTSLLQYAGIAGLIEEAVGREIDVAMKDRLKEHVRPHALRDAVDAF